MTEKPSSRGTSSSGWAVMDRTWEVVQKKTFTKWVNAHLRKSGHREVVEELSKDLYNGVVLHKLLESISGQKLPKILPVTKFRLQNIQNLNVCLEFIARSGVKLIGISAEEIADGNLKLILGMIWTIILRFEIQDISIEDLTAKEGLLYWCQKKTHGYKDVDVRDFTRSWHDGLAFCALIHKHRPDLIDFDSLSKANPEANLELAFSVADKHLNIPRFLDVEDMPIADDRSVMTYLLQYFHAFAGSRKNEVAGRRISKLVGLMQANEELRQDYESKAREFVRWADAKHAELAERKFDNTLEGAKKLLEGLEGYQKDEKPQRAAQKLAVEGVLANLQVKLRNQKRSPYVPPPGIAPADIDSKWEAVLGAEKEREKAIRDEIARQEKMEDMARRFYEKLAKLKSWERAKKEYLAQRPTIDTVIAAQSQIKLLDGYGKLYEASKTRVAELHQLGEELVKMGYRDSEKIKSELGWTDGAWSSLAEDERAKRKWLEAELAKQEEMERLRLEFADKAKKLSRWYKDTNEAVTADHDFGYTLAKVRAHAAKLDEADAGLSRESAEKKADLERVADAMSKLGVEDNKYTVITLEDIAAAERGMEAAIGKRRDRYAAELARQEAMEAKRIEYAKAAQDFVDFLAEQRAEIDKLGGDDPDALIAAIEEIHQKGKPAGDKLADVARIDREAIAMQITDNPHTKWTQPALDAEYFDANAYVDHYVAELVDEKELKHQYAERAAKLIAWTAETSPRLAEQQSPAANLAEARAKRAAFNEYRTGQKPPKTAEKAAVLKLHESLTEALAASPHRRPPYVAPAGLAPADVEAAWAELEEAEKALADFVAAEIARHEKLAALERKIHEEAAELDKFAAKEEQYLSSDAEEKAIESVADARICLHRAETHAEEIKQRGPRIEALRADAAVLEAEKQSGAAKAAERVEAVAARVDGAGRLCEEKHQRLQAILAAEERKEQLRIAFAQAAREYASWSAERCDDLEDATFGDGLGPVRAYREKLDALEPKVRAESEARRTALDQLAADLAAAGATGINPHTPLTQDDVAKFADSVEQALTAHRERYERELARQEAMEAKRLEFAKAAQALADALAAGRSAIDALEGEDPVALREAVKAQFADATAERAMLAEVDRLYSEELKLEITENKHTTLTPAALKRSLREYVTYVNAYVVELEDEANLRAQYAKRAGDLVRWIVETEKLLASGGARPIDNTLAGAQAAMEAFTEYRGSTKPAKAVERDAVKATHASATARLAESKHHRPAFRPADAAHTPEAITKAFAALDKAEAALAAKLTEELQRQEGLSGRAHEFETAASELEAWCKQTGEELAREERADTVEAARIAADVLAAFDKDYAEGAKARVAPLQAMAASLAADKYSEAAATTARCAEVVAMWGALKAARDAKAARVAAANEREAAKEALRLEWAKKAAEYERWANDTCGKVSKYAFGTTLDAVRAARAQVDESTKEISQSSDAHKAALDALAAKLVQSGVAENVHSSLTPADVAEFQKSVGDALAKREAAYSEELARQEAMEAKRLEFARKAKEFVDKVAASHAALERIAGDDPEKCAAEARQVYGDDARKELADALATCAECDKEAKDMKIVDYKHTKHTLASLQRRLAAHEKYFENLLGALGEEKMMKDRQAERAAEWKRKEEIESLRGQYAELQSKLSSWMDGASEELSGQPEVRDPAEVEALRKAFDAIASDAIVGENKATFSKMTELAKKLTEAGIPAAEIGHEANATAWAEANQIVAARKAWLAKEAERQAKHLELRKAYAAAAAAFHEYLEKSKRVSPSGELAQQLEQTEKQLAEVRATGKEREAGLAKLDKDLAAAGVRGNPLTPHTTAALHLEFTQLLDVIDSRKQLLEQQISSAKYSLPAEQVAEIVELFNQFDKDRIGKLNWYQFKAVLAAIDEDLTDDQIKAVIAEYDKDKSGAISKDEFITYMTKRRADSDSKEEILAAFRDISGGRDWVTIAELAPVVGPEQLKYIQEHVPRKEGQPDALDFGKWTEAAFK